MRYITDKNAGFSIFFPGRGIKKPSSRRMRAKETQ
jgi:hypothetical protein